MRIQQINNDTTFYGVTQKLSKRVYYNAALDLKNYMEARGDKSGVVGRLPSFIIKKLPKENLEGSIKEILNAFSKAAFDLREFRDRGMTTLAEIIKGRPEEVVEDLKSVLIKNNVISKFDDFDLTYLGAGGKGSAYKLQGIRDLKHPDEDEFIMKVFHVINLGDYVNYQHHGTFAEINAAAYWMKHIGYDTNRGKFFWGDVKSGYMINKYVDEDVRLPRRMVIPEEYGLTFTDEDIKTDHNVVKNYSFDWGGCYCADEYYDSNDSFMTKTIGQVRYAPYEKRLETWHRIFNTKTKHDDSKFAGLARSISYLPQENRIELFDMCLKLNNLKVNRCLAKIIETIDDDKILPEYIETLMKTNDLIIQKRIAYNTSPEFRYKYSKIINDNINSVVAAYKNSFSHMQGGK